MTDFNEAWCGYDDTPQFVLSDDEIEALYDYFLKYAGYVSYEFSPLVLVIIKRLRDHVKGAGA